MEYLGLSISYFSVFSSPFQIVQVWSLSCASFLGHVQKCRQSLCYRIFIIVKKQKSDSLSKDAGHRRDSETMQCLLESGLYLRHCVY